MSETISRLLRPNLKGKCIFALGWVLRGVQKATNSQKRTLADPHIALYALKLSGICDSDQKEQLLVLLVVVISKNWCTAEFVFY